MPATSGGGRQKRRDFFGHIPRVAPTSQPWAGCYNSVGVVRGSGGKSEEGFLRLTAQALHRGLTAPYGDGEVQPTRAADSPDGPDGSVADVLHMHIEQKHNLGKAEAIRRIDAKIEEAMRQGPPAGITMANFTKTWSGDTLRISFTAKKGFFGVNIAGVVQVTNDLVTMDADLPGLLTAFMPEEKIRGDIQKQLGQMLAG